MKIKRTLDKFENGFNWTLKLNWNPEAQQSLSINNKLVSH